MAMNKYFGIFIWINDDPVTGNVLNLCNIVEPRKPLEDYKEADEVTAKCPSYGLQKAVLGKISDQSGKKALDATLAGKDFKDLVDRVWSNLRRVEEETNGARPVLQIEQEQVDELVPKTAEKRKRKRPVTVLPPMPSDDEMSNDKEMMDELENELVQKKTALDDTQMPVRKELQTEAQNAKKEAARQKRQREKVLAEASSRMSLEVLPDESMPSKLDQLLTEVASVKAEVKAVASNQEKLLSLIEPLLQTFQCNQCLKLMYKGNKRSTLNTVVPLRCSSLHSPVLKSPVASPPPPVTNSQSLMETKSPTQSVSKQMEEELQEMDMSVMEENDVGDLVYLGETKFGVQMRRDDLTRCMEQSSTPEKLGLNLLEFLVTVEDCLDMTVYGHGKQKKEMAPNMRRAIRSQIFSRFLKEKNEEEKSRYWMETIVYKLNDKIRGLRNGKYKSKKNVDC